MLAPPTALPAPNPPADTTARPPPQVPAPLSRTPLTPPTAAATALLRTLSDAAERGTGLPRARSADTATLLRNVVQGRLENADRQNAVAGALNALGHVALHGAADAERRHGEVGRFLTENQAITRGGIQKGHDHLFRSLRDASEVTNQRRNEEGAWLKDSEQGTRAGIQLGFDRQRDTLEALKRLAAENDAWGKGMAQWQADITNANRQGHERMHDTLVGKIDEVRTELMNLLRRPTETRGGDSDLVAEVRKVQKQVEDVTRNGNDYMSAAKRRRAADRRQGQIALEEGFRKAIEIGKAKGAIDFDKLAGIILEGNATSESARASEAATAAKEMRAWQEAQAGVARKLQEGLEKLEGKETLTKGDIADAIKERAKENRKIQEDLAELVGKETLTKEEFAAAIKERLDKANAALVAAVKTATDSVGRKFTDALDETERRLVEALEEKVAVLPTSRKLRIQVDGLKRAIAQHPGAAVLEQIQAGIASIQTDAASRDPTAALADLNSKVVGLGEKMYTKDEQIRILKHLQEQLKADHLETPASQLAANMEGLGGALGTAIQSLQQQGHQSMNEMRRQGDMVAGTHAIAKGLASFAGGQQQQQPGVQISEVDSGALALPSSPLINPWLNAYRGLVSADSILKRMDARPAQLLALTANLPGRLQIGGRRARGLLTDLAVSQYQLAEKEQAREVEASAGVMARASDAIASLPAGVDKQRLEALADNIVRRAITTRVATSKALNDLTRDTTTFGESTASSPEGLFGDTRLALAALDTEEAIALQTAIESEINTLSTSLASRIGGAERVNAVAQEEQAAVASILAVPDQSIGELARQIDRLEQELRDLSDDAPGGDPPTSPTSSEGSVNMG